MVLSGRREFLKSSATVAALAVYGNFRIKAKADHVSAATRGGESFLRPPGACLEDEFLSRCIRCHKCGENCPNDVIKFVGPEGPPEARGTPYIVPREKGCILCQTCNNGCPSGALRPVDAEAYPPPAYMKMGVAELDENLCFSRHGYICGICIRACPYAGEALTAGPWEAPVLNPEKCVGCGLCEQACVHMPQALRIRPERV
jgi:MauM/NapG family ferredoxin protein